MVIAGFDVRDTKPGRGEGRGRGRGRREARRELRIVSR